MGEEGMGEGFKPLVEGVPSLRSFEVFRDGWSPRRYPLLVKVEVRRKGKKCTRYKVWAIEISRDEYISGDVGYVEYRDYKDGDGEVVEELMVELKSWGDWYQVKYALEDFLERVNWAMEHTGRIMADHVTAAMLAVQLLLDAGRTHITIQARQKTTIRAAQ